MALPIDGLALHDKQDAIRRLMLRGADIHALNTVRKHLSGVKGGRLAAACSGTTVTLAISDVVGDDVSVIGSGPGVPDTTTWRQVAAIVERFGPASAALRVFIEHGLAGRIAETPKPGDAAMRRVHAHVIASRRHALAAARAHAEALGYHVTVLEGDVTGESRDAARPWLRKALIASADLPVPRCVLSAGETTVRVSGGGRGGRNQEFALAVSRELRTVRDDVLAASVGTDGIDGPTDAAGAMADRTTIARGEALGLDWSAFLDDNNAYDFFASLGDLIHLGRTDTNVGDVQVLLTGGE
jgi:hydroxypyruvate reductase